MNYNEDFIEQIFNKQGNLLELGQDQKYRTLGLKFNPFPRSGTTNINGSDLFNQKLIPVNDKVKDQIISFIAHALNDNLIDKEDKFISATITGNYGSGKTQLLMFVKYILGQVAMSNKRQKNPYVIYIDSPGVNLLEFVGTVISKIGEEDFKKFIWSKIISAIGKSDKYSFQLSKFEAKGVSLFPNTNPNPFSDENSISYKKFLDAYVRYLTTPKIRKEFDQVFKRVIIEILEIEVNDSTLAQYFYEFIAEDYGVNKTWEALSSGTIKQLDKKEAEIIKYIVKLIKEQGYTDFFILVDEFEDITEGRLNKSQIDNYVYNLRTLLDEHREWCLLFSMTGLALKKLRSLSPPLADRISTRLITLENLNKSEAERIVINYLSFAKDSSAEGIRPFDISGIQKLNDLVDGNARKFLKNCYFMVEKAVEQNADVINEIFITSNYSNENI